MNILRTQSCRSYLFSPSKNFSVYSQNLSRITYEEELSEKPNRNRKSLKRIYSEAWGFHSNRDLLAHLAGNVIHLDRKSGLVVINKPYGLALKPTVEVPICLENCLKEFAKVIGFKTLEVLKTAPRFSSGCTILSSSPVAKGTFTNCRARIRNSKILHENFLAVTLGQPKRHGFTENIDVFMEKIPGKMNMNDKPVIEPVLSRDLMSRTKLSESDRKTTFRISVNLKTVSKAGNGNAALVSICPTATKQNLLQAYMADQLCPILGDQYFGYRVKELMGHPTKVSHLHTPGTPMPQSLPQWMLQLIGLKPGDEDLIPVHFHLFRVHLPHYYGKDKHLTVYAPPPQFFQSTLEVLALKFDLDEVKNSDTIDFWKTANPKTKKRKTGSEVEILSPDDIVTSSSHRHDLLE